MSLSAPHPRTALIVGASSGIGEALARELARRGGWRLGLAARRGERLDALASALRPTPCIVRPLDLTAPDQGRTDLAALVSDLGSVDLCLICAGVGYPNPRLTWEPERETLAVNVLGFAAAANVAIEHLVARGQGHLVGISSIAALRGSGQAPAYAASKAFVSTYLDGLRAYARTEAPKVRVTEVAPGFVATAMLKADWPFWVATPEQAARSILHAAFGGKKHAYVTRRWRLVAALLRVLPRPG